MANTDDIRKTGPVGLKGLSAEQQERIRQAQQSAIQTYLGNYQTPLQSTTDVQRYSPSESMASWGTSQYDTQTDSNYLDSGLMQDTRYENQPWYDTLANGVGKMLGTAGTTFVSSLVGLPTGIATAIGEQRWSGLWDNEVTNALGDVDKWLEENMTNYKSTEQQNAPWYSLSNLGSMNFWADDVIKNAGFTLGAAASMAVGSGSLGLLAKSFGFVNDVSKGAGWGNKIASALFSATGEGMIEARNGVEERNKLELKKLEDALAPEKEALDEEFNLINAQYSADGDYNAYKQRMADYAARRDEFSQKMDLGRQQIEESGRAMGDKILLGNQVLLTAGNIIQFSKLMNKSFNNARHAAETTSKMSKPFLAGAERVSNNLADGYKVTGKGIGRLHAATKGVFTEGSEEMNQQWIQNTASYTEQAKDANDYWKAKYDDGAYKDTVEGMYTLGNAISQGFKDSWGDINQWEQFVIGGLTGLAGSYAPTKLFNQDKTKSRWNPLRYGEWSGGAFVEVPEFNKQFNQYKENVDDLNKVLAQDNFGERTRNLIAHTYFESSKDAALKENDKKTWKDEDDKQAIHDIQAFLRAGKLDDLRAIYNEMSKDMSDEEVEDIVKRSTQEVSAEDNKQQFDAQIDTQIAEKQSRINGLNSQIDALSNSLEGSDPSAREANENYVHQQIHDLQMQVNSEEDEIEKLQEKKASYSGEKTFISPYLDSKGNRIKTNDEIRDEIRHNTDEMSRKLDSYLDSIDYVNKRTNGQLTKDQEDNLAYLHNISKEKDARFQKIMSDVRKRLPSKFFIKTNSTPEQLTKQYASSDLAFSKTDDTPEGYVEVDTSMMNDNNFGAFFADTVLWGDNIQASYTREDIMEELEAREEDKKYSEEEQKKRREERAKKQQEKADKKVQETEKERQEQQNKNVHLIRKAFVDNAMQNEGKSLTQALNDDALEQIFNDINDALGLRNEAADFENTLREYMLNPQKVDQAKKKAEKANEDKIRKQEEDKASVKDMMDMDDDALAATVLGGRKGKNKNGKKAQKAMGMKNGRSKAEKSLDEAVASGKITREAADDAMKLMDSQISKMLEENDEDDYEDMKSVVSKLFDTSTEAMDDAEALWDDELRSAINNGAVEWEEVEDDFQARLDSAKDAIRLISDPVEKELEDYDQSIDMGKQFKDLETEEQKGTEELDAKLSQAADESKAAENPDSTSNRNGSEKSEALKAVRPRSAAKTRTSNKKKTQPEPEELEEPEVKLNTAGEDAALEEDKASGEKGNTGTQGNKVWGLWHTGVSEVSQYGNEPWTVDPSDPNAELQQKRYDAIRKKLMDGAYTARKLGKVTPGMKVGFKIFQDVNDAAGDFVVFITDEKDNIIGDLPSEDARFNREKFPISMDDLYKALHEEWDDATDEEKSAGMQSQYTTVVDEVLVGKVRYQEDRQTVEQLTSGSDTKVKPLFAIKRPVDRKTGKDTSNGAVELRMDTGTDNQGRPLVSGVHMPLTGKAGQPYVLIQTPGVYTDSPIKYLAVPIKTMTVGETVPDSIFNQVLRQLLYRIKNSSDKNKKNQISDFDARRVLEALLSVSSAHVNLNEGSNTKKELGIRIRSFNRESGITKGAPYTIYEGKREDMDVDAIMEALANVQINVSSQLINGGSKDSIAKYLTINGEPVSYNEMLAEVAHTNAAEPQTVNDWFTIKPLQQKGDDLQMVENSVKMESWADVEIDDPDVTSSTGETWTVKVSEGYTVYDAEGKQITTKTHGKDKAKEAAILAAEKFGEVNSKPTNRPYAVLINGKSYIFNPVNRTFKTYAQAEKDPQYVYEKVKDGKKLTEQEKYTIMKEALERQMLELDELWEERRRQQETAAPQQPSARVQSINSEDIKNIILEYDNNGQINARNKAVEYLSRQKDGDAYFGKTIEEWDKAVDYVSKVIAKRLEQGENIDDIIHSLGNNSQWHLVGIGGAFLQNTILQIIKERLNQEEKSGKNTPGTSEGKEKDHTEEVRAAIAKMEEESKHYKLVKWDKKQKKYVEDKDGNYYRDDRDGSIHARVSNVNDVDIEVIEANKKAGFGGNSPAFVPSTGAGNVVDRFVREFFRNGDLFEGLDLSTTEDSNTAMERLKDTANDASFQNINTADMIRLGRALHEFKQSLGADWKINSSGIVASGIVSFDGNTMVKVAGTIDLLAYNEKTGQYGIIDMKTHLASLFRNNGDLRTDVKTLAKLAHWRAQQTLYKQFLETKFNEDGVKNIGLRIMPFKINYSTKFTETDYEVGDDGVLRDKGIVVDINPEYDGQLIRLTPKQNTKYDVGQLPESIKRLLPRKKAPIVKQPEDPEVEVKGKLIDIRDSVPEGRSLEEFISAKYKDDDNVKKLVEILEANRGEANPVMMTQASQKLLLAAINQRVLDKAIQEAKAAAEKLKVDIPEQEEMDLDTFIEELEASGGFSDDVIEFIQELPEDLQKKVMNSNLATIISVMIDQDASDEDIQQAIRNYDLNARHKKAVKEYTLIDLPKELRWMRENLPQLSSERRLHIIKGLIRCSDGTESFGQVNASMILIGTQAAEGTVYHEAFHAIVQFLLTDNEINSLFEAAKKRWGDLPAAALEERMADEFENYMKGLDPEDSKIKRFFKELWRAIRAWLENKSYMENLYRDINNGVYASRDVRDDRSNAFNRIRSEQRDTTKDYSFLTDDEKERVKEAGISKENWNQLTKEQQEYMLHCVV